MTSTRLWDRAAALPVPADGRRRAEVAALPRDMPSVAELFTFMRDAELRFATLRMRIEERTFGSRGEQIVTVDVAVRHPGAARVMTMEGPVGGGGSHETWISDGEIVRTFSRTHRLGTSRPVRPRPRGLDDADFPGTSQVYRPLTALPAETLPETFVHPAGYCQNVLATGRAWISGTEIVHGREAIVVECDHPRAIEMAADRPDFHISIAADRDTGAIIRLVETIAGDVTRFAEAVVFDPDASLPAGTFEFHFPTGTTILY